MAGTLLVFIIFLILLLKVNRSVDTADLEPADKPVFWVIFNYDVTVIGTVLANGIYIQHCYCFSIDNGHNCDIVGVDIHFTISNLHP